MTRKMKVLFRQARHIFVAAFFFVIIACEHTLEPAFDFSDILFLEDTFMEAEQLYSTGDPDALDLAINKFKLVLKHDTENCFVDAYFFLANIYFIRNNSSQAKDILLQGKELYSKLGEQGCISDIIQRFDEYLERMSPDSLIGSPIFVAYDVAPSPVGGFGEIQGNLEYPQDAIDMGIEGRVIVQVLIDCLGHPCMTRVLKSGSLPSMDTAARKAIKSLTWKPALQRNNPVRVWVAIPVIFRLD